MTQTATQSITSINSCYLLSNSCAWPWPSSSAAGCPEEKWTPHYPYLGGAGGSPPPKAPVLVFPALPWPYPSCPYPCPYPSTPSSESSSTGSIDNLDPFPLGGGTGRPPILCPADVRLLPCASSPRPPMVERQDCSTCVCVLKKCQNRYRDIEIGYR